MSKLWTQNRVTFVLILLSDLIYDIVHRYTYFQQQKKNMISFSLTTEYKKTMYLNSNVCFGKKQWCINI